MKRTAKIRINELARELEVKAGAIIDCLPGFGVEEPKTHSSSLEEEVANKVREVFRRESADKDTLASSAETPPPAPASAVDQAKLEKVLPPLSPRRKEVPSLRPSIPIGRGATPLRPPVQALRPPLRRPAAQAAPVTAAIRPVPGEAPGGPAAPPAPPLAAAAARPARQLRRPHPGDSQPEDSVGQFQAAGGRGWTAGEADPDSTGGSGPSGAVGSSSRRARGSPG